ncbi:MAG: hypothetical protein U0326_01915 [Polyangiales bacterium]
MTAARRTSTLALALPAALLCARECRADPLALRAPVAGRVVTATFGTPELSAGAWLSDRFGFAVEWHLPASAVGGSIATRRTLVGERMGWGVDLTLAGGLTVPLISLAGAVSFTPALVGRWRNDYVHVAASVVSPMVLRVVPDPALRLPLLLEVWLIGHYRRLSLGVQGSVGSVFVTGLSWAYAIQASGFVGWDL